MDKKMKAEAKRARRIAAKDAPPVVYDTDPQDDDEVLDPDDESLPNAHSDASGD